MNCASQITNLYTTPKNHHTKRFVFYPSLVSWYRSISELPTPVMRIIQQAYIYSIKIETVLSSFPPSTAGFSTVSCSTKMQKVQFCETLCDAFVINLILNLRAIVCDHVCEILIFNWTLRKSSINPLEKRYAVVEFPDGISVVPTVWMSCEKGINGDNIYSCGWPDRSSAKGSVRKMARDEVPINKSTWDRHYDVRVFGASSKYL